MSPASRRPTRIASATASSSLIPLSSMRYGISAAPTRLPLEQWTRTRLRPPSCRTVRRAASNVASVMSPWPKGMVPYSSPAARTASGGREVLLATTTSTRDAGLLDSLVPVFERTSGYNVKVIAVGSGQALEMGRRGDADVVLAHAPEAERVLVDSGYFITRRLVMHNDFLIVGPAADPAHLGGMTDALAALRRLAERGAPFVSRGDQSGTHKLEQKLWRLAGIKPPGAGGWYIEAGHGMGETLQMADGKRAYTITDPSR